MNPRASNRVGKRLACVGTGRLHCGCFVDKYDVGDGWNTFRLRRCRAHWYVPRTFLRAPCDCVVWADGVHERCPRHDFSPIQAVRGVQ